MRDLVEAGLIKKHTTFNFLATSYRLIVVKYLQVAVICNQQYRHPDRRCLKLIPIVGFFGYSNSGKTTVVANLTKILSGQGYRIAAIKHAAHGYDVDIPGKDSWQLFKAGAQKVLVVGLESITTHERIERDFSLQSILDRLQSDENIDLILVEGFKNEPGPKIQVIRDQDADIPDGEVDLIATVSDGPFKDDVPYYPYGQLELLAEFLAVKYLRD